MTSAGLWTSMRQLRELSEFYERERRVPNLTTDEVYLEAVQRSFWVTNSVDFVDAAFAIVAPGCRLRPHLTRQMLRAPIRAAVASGVEDPDAIVAWGLRCADAAARVSVRPTPDGAVWLRHELPALRDVVKETVAETLAWIEAGFPGDDLW